MPRTDTKTLIAALRTLSQHLQTDDGAANAAIAEAADRLEELGERKDATKGPGTIFWDTLPPGIREAMARNKAYKQGRTAREVFGQHVGRAGYHDDCQLIADFVSLRVIESLYPS